MFIVGLSDFNEKIISSKNFIVPLERQEKIIFDVNS